ncbi:MAG: TIGR01244 family sulfur transferase [Pseudomonadota bacterium]
MDLRPLTDHFAVSPQITPQDVQVLADSGFHMIINNRPDAENPPEFWSAEIEKAATVAGITFLDNPIIGGMLDEASVEQQAKAMAAAGGPVVAYCASGMRSAAAWALAAAPTMDPDEIFDRLHAAGYALDGLRPTVEARAEKQT